jgi:hypothetical protein
MTSDSDIQGALLRLKREALGWTLADMAARACLSTKQVKQLEEGGDSAFYSLAIKLTVAKKLAQILDVTEDELFGRHLVTEETLELSSQTQSIAQDVLSQSVLEQQMLSPAEPMLPKTAEPLAASTEPVTPGPQVAPKPELKLQTHADDAVLTQADAPVTLQTHAETVALVAESAPNPSFKATQASSLSEQASTLPVALSLPSNESSLSNTPDTKAPLGFGVKVLLFLLVMLGVILIVEPKAKDDFLDLLKSSGLISNASVDSPQTQELVPVPMVEPPAVDPVVELAKPALGSTTSTQPTASPLSGTSSTAPSKIPSTSTPANAGLKSTDGAILQSPSAPISSVAKPASVSSNPSSGSGVSTSSTAVMNTSPAVNSNNTPANASSAQGSSSSKE